MLKKIIQYVKEVYQFQWQDMVMLASMVERTIEMAMTITGHSAYITINNGEREMTWVQLD